MEVNKLDPFFFTTSDFRCDGRPCEVGWMRMASVQRVVWTCFFATYGHSSMKNHIELDFVHQQDMFGRDKTHL